MRKRDCLLFSNICFRFKETQALKLCKLVKWWHHKLDRILLQFDEKRDLNQFVSEMFFFLKFY